MTPTSREHNDRGPESSGNDSGGYGPPGGHEGGTQLYDAIYLASDELMKPQAGRKALVVFSDGADHGSKETLNDAIDAADRANVQVFTIYFKGEQERPMNGPSGGGHPGGMGGGGHPGGSVEAGPAVAAEATAVAHRAAKPEPTAGRSFSRLPSAPAASSSKPKRRTISIRYTTRSLAARQAVSAHLYPR